MVAISLQPGRTMKHKNPGNGGKKRKRLVLEAAQWERTDWDYHAALYPLLRSFGMFDSLIVIAINEKEKC